MSASPPAEIGDVVGGYRLDRILGRGGMGFVYQATQLSLNKKVALKMLKKECASEARFVARFFREARIVNEVRHPNIIDIFDFIDLEEPRRIAYAMELIEGPTLTTLLADGPLSPLQAVNIAIQITDALGAVHARDVIHRDLKPDNVLMLAPRESDFRDVPSVKVLDFGIAKFTLPNGERQTRTGVMLGTPQYMAPEQVSAATVTAAADVYAVGEVLFEMLAARPLFTGKAIDMLRTKLSESVTVPDDIGPPALVRLIQDCIALEPHARPLLGALEERLSEIRRQLEENTEIDAPADLPDLPGFTATDELTERAPVPLSAASRDTQQSSDERLPPPAPAPFSRATVLAVSALAGCVAFAVAVWTMADVEKPVHLDTVPIASPPLPFVSEVKTASVSAQQAELSPIMLPAAEVEAPVQVARDPDHHPKKPLSPQKKAKKAGAAATR